MDRCLLLLFLLFALEVSHAALPAQVYWHTVLPSTPMPGAIRDRLRPDELVDDKAGTTVNVGKGGVNVNTGKGTTVGVARKGVGVNTGQGTSVGVGGGGVNVNTGKGKPGGTSVNVGHGGVGVNVTGKGNTGTGTSVNTGRGTNVGVGGGGVNVNTGKGKPGGTSVNVGHGGVGVNVKGKGNTGNKGKPVVVNVKPGKSPFVYQYAATETQIHDDPNVALFFLEKDLRPGAKMNLYFTKTTSGAAFIPRRAADSIPFSTRKFPEVLSKFSIEPNSVDAEAMKQTLKECEEPAAEGENKYCATSLESMVDFSTSILGTRDVQAVSTEVGTRSAVKQEYTVAPSGAQRMPGSKLVACHAEAYAYAVFYCHETGKTRAYTVPLVGKDGTAVEAVAVCHTNTASWNPRHIAFQMLDVKPGTLPICHFLPQDHVVWTPSP